MSFYRSIKVVVVLLSLVGIARPSWASCGCASCPLDTRSALQTVRNQIRVGYEFEYIDQNQPRVGTQKAEVGEIPGHHDEVRSINRTHRFLAAWGVTDRVSLDLSVPFVSRSHRHIHNHMGMAMTEGWNYSGVGDVMLQSRWAFYKPQELSHPVLSGIVGVKFPTGKTDVTNSDGDGAEPSMTPGSGSYDVVVGAASLQRFTVPTLQGDSAILPLFVSLTYRINGKGTEDYQIGNVWSANAGITYPLWRRLGLITQVNLVVKGKDDAGNTSEETDVTGGDFLYVSPGIQVTLARDLDWSTIIQVPVHQRVNNIQLTSDYNLLTNLSYRFRL